MEDDVFLLSQLANDSTVTYSYLIDKYYQKLFIYALNLCNDQALGKDIVQNVYLKIWEKRKTLDHDYPIKNLLYKMVYNEFATQYQKTKSLGILEQKYVETINLLTENYEESTMEKKLNILKKEIERLPPKCKKVFLLSKYEGLSNKEIAQYLDISINTVENHITKAFSLLRKKVSTIKTLLFLLFGAHAPNNSPRRSNKTYYGPSSVIN